MSRLELKPLLNVIFESYEHIDSLKMELLRHGVKCGQDIPFPIVALVPNNGHLHSLFNHQITRSVGIWSRYSNYTMHCHALSKWSSLIDEMMEEIELENNTNELLLVNYALLPESTNKYLCIHIFSSIIDEINKLCFKLEEISSSIFEN